MAATNYDPFLPGSFAVGVRTIEAHDAEHDRLFPCDVWYPTITSEAQASPDKRGERDATAHPGPHPLILFSHSSGGNRRSSTFLCSHLASHGYVVAAMDHSEVVAPELARRDGETAEATAARIQKVIASRVPDVRFLLDHLLDGNVPGIELDAARIGLVGHSFGGWTVLATPEADSRIGAVVALAPGGSSRPRPGILPLTLAFVWGRDIPTLYLAAENDVPIPLDSVVELFDRTPATKRMFILRRADHQHFLDDVEGTHEAIRAMQFPGEAAWIPRAMQPIDELCSGEHAHVFVRGLTLANFDATLRQSGQAERFLDGDVEAALAVRGVEAITFRP